MFADLLIMPRLLARVISDSKHFKLFYRGLVIGAAAKLRAARLRAREELLSTPRRVSSKTVARRGVSACTGRLAQTQRPLFRNVARETSRKDLTSPFGGDDCATDFISINV